ncbi:MAG: hypothetical protein JRH20_02205 [Deltaproteobacteria bacterium]|nr:hypothetical protein [Deltaproteobacteria bacterium]
MVKRSGDIRLLLLLCGLLSACSTDVGTLEVRLLRSPRAEEDPFSPTSRLVNLLSVRVDGPDGRVGPIVISVENQAATLPEVPVGDDQVIEIQGFPGEGSLPTALARSAPMTIRSGLNTVELYFGRTNRFSAAPASGDAEGMKTTRTYHTATLLPKGDVIALGGTSEDWRPNITEMVPKALSSFSLLDGDSLRFLPLDCTQKAERCMIAGRVGHTTTALPSGNLLVAGGTVGGIGSQLPVDTTEVMLSTPQLFTFSPKMRSPRLGHAAVRQGSLVLLAGGLMHPSFPAPNKLVEAYVDGQFSEHSTFQEARRDFTLTRLADGALFACGGIDGEGRSLASTEILGVDGRTWRLGPPMQQGRAFPVTKLLTDGSVLIVGGLESSGTVRAVERYDPETNTLTEVAQLTLGRWAHTVTQLRDGRVLVVGGYGVNVNGAPSTSVEILTPPIASGLRWIRANAEPLRTPRAGHTATLLPNQMVVVIGGVTGGGGDVSNTAEVFVN